MFHFMKTRLKYFCYQFLLKSGKIKYMDLIERDVFTCVLLFQTDWRCGIRYTFYKILFRGRRMGGVFPYISSVGMLLQRLDFCLLVFVCFLVCDRGIKISAWVFTIIFSNSKQNTKAEFPQPSLFHTLKLKSLHWISEERMVRILRNLK